MATVMTKNGFISTTQTKFYVEKIENNCDGEGWSEIQKKHKAHWYKSFVCSKCERVSRKKRVYGKKPADVNSRIEYLVCTECY